MSESSKIDKELYIHKFLSGELSSDEKSNFSAWLEENDDNRRAYEEISSIWNASLNIPRMHEFDYNAALEKHRLRLKEENSHYTPNIKKINVIPLRIWALAIAAVSVLVFFVTVLLKEKHKEEVHYAKSESINFKLPDNSEVWLKEGSALTVKEFKSKEKLVELTGIALFEVQHDNNRKFRVSAGELLVEVLGTVFVVDSYNQYVWLKSGSVKLTSGDMTTILKPGESASLTNGTLIKKDSVPSTVDALDWVNSNLSFDKTPLHKVLRDIELHFKVEINVEDNLDISQCYFTSGSMKSSSLEEIFNVLKLSFNMEIVENAPNLYSVTQISCK